MDPLKSKTYFKSNKYLNNVQMMYDNGDEKDQQALGDILSEGYSVTDEYWRQRAEQNLPGWQEQVERAGAQAWTLVFSEKEHKFKANCTYEDDAYSDEEYQSDDEEKAVLGEGEEEKKGEVEPSDRPNPLQHYMTKLTVM